MPRNRVFAVSLAISTLFHLSMVTLFSIVLMFERHDLPYVEFELRRESPQERLASEAASPDRLEIQVPSAGLSDESEPWDRVNSLRNESLALEPRVATPELPGFELPTLQFAELARLRLGQETLRGPSDVVRFLEPQPRDPWARFGRELGQLTHALKQFGTAQVRADQPEPAPTPALVSRPAPGFEAYVEWMSKPHDRLVLSTPPIQALWGRDPAELEGPISLMFTVNADGRVVEVLNPMDDELATSIGIALSKYRFAPLVGSDTNQQGTFRIVGVRSPEQP